MGYRSKGKGRSTGKYDDPGRMIVIDVPNVSAAAGVDHYAMEGLLKCVEYYQSRGYPVLCVVPNRFLLRDQLESKKKRGDFTYRITARETLLDLKEQRLLVVTPAGSYDDTFAIQTMIRTDGCIVSNDIFRDGTTHAPQKWLDERRISFTFLPVTMDFIPNADFVFPPRGIPPYETSAQTALLEEPSPSYPTETQCDSFADSTERKRQASKAKSKTQGAVAKPVPRDDTVQALDNAEQRYRVQTNAQQHTQERRKQRPSPAEAATGNGKAGKKKRAKNASKKPVVPEAFAPERPLAETSGDMSMDVEDDTRRAASNEELKAKAQEESQKDDTIVYFTPSGLKIEKPRRPPQPEEKQHAQTREVEYIRLRRRGTAAKDHLQKHDAASKFSREERATSQSAAARRPTDEPITFSASSEPFVPSYKKTRQQTPRAHAGDSSPHEPAEAGKAPPFRRQKATLSLAAHKDTKASKPLTALKRLVATYQDMGLCQTVHQMVQARQTRPQASHLQRCATQQPAPQRLSDSTPSFAPQPFQCTAGAQQGFACNTPHGQRAWQGFATAPQASTQPFGAPPPAAFAGSSLPTFSAQSFCATPSGAAGMFGGSAPAQGATLQNGFAAGGSQLRFM